MAQTKADRSAAAKKGAATRERNRKKAESEAAGKKAAGTRQQREAGESANQAKSAALGAVSGAAAAARLAETPSSRVARRSRQKRLARNLDVARNSSGWYAPSAIGGERRAAGVGPPTTSKGMLSRGGRYPWFTAAHRHVQPAAVARTAFLRGSRAARRRRA